MELYTRCSRSVARGRRRRPGATTATCAKMIEIKVSYDTDARGAERACHWWGALGAHGARRRVDVEDPLELERLADAHPERAASRFIVSTDPDEVVDRIAPYVELGFTELVFHGPGDGPGALPRAVRRDVLPRLRERFGA